MRLMNSCKKAMNGCVAEVATLFSGFWFLVVAPHRQGLDMGVEAALASDLLPPESRKFSDCSNTSIPEITAHLIVDALVKQHPHGPRSRAVRVAGAATLAVIAAGVTYGVGWGVVACMLVVTALLVAPYGGFQEVMFPPETIRLRLEFKSFARHAWLAHAFWSLLRLLAGVRSWQAH